MTALVLVSLKVLVPFAVGWFAKKLHFSATTAQKINDVANAAENEVTKK
jgi:hypothetical protein